MHFLSFSGSRYRTGMIFVVLNAQFNSFKQIWVERIQADDEHKRIAPSIAALISAINQRGDASHPPGTILAVSMVSFNLRTNALSLRE